MDIDATMQDDRRSSTELPARLRLGKAFGAPVGVNDSGKSSLLRFFQVLRNPLGMLSGPNGNLLMAL